MFKTLPLEAIELLKNMQKNWLDYQRAMHEFSRLSAQLHKEYDLSYEEISILLKDVRNDV